MPQQGTGFVSLGQYLAANQGAVGNMANSLAGRDAQEGASAEAADDALGKQAQRGFAEYQATGPQIAPDEGYVPGAYDPTSLPDFTTAQSKTANAAQDVSGLGQDGYTQQQLQRQYGGNGNYSNADASFDSNLLGGSNQAQSTFNQVKGQYAGLGDYFNNAIQKARAGGYAAPPTSAAPGGAYAHPDTVEPTAGGNSPDEGGSASGGPGDVFTDYQKPPRGGRAKSNWDNGDF